MVASHTEKPLGFSKWLERNTPHKNIACPWVGDIVKWGYRPYQPFRSPQGDNCMAGYHCLMPTAFLPLQHNTKSNAYGISSVAKQHKIKRLRHFFRCNITQNQTPTAFSFIKNKTRFAEFTASSTISHKLCKNIALKTPNNLCCFRCHYSELAYTLVLFLERMLLIIRQKEPAMWLASLK